MSQADLARRADLSTKHVNQIISGAASITAETALRLERVTSIPARFWTNLEAQYKEDRSRIEETENLEADLPWLKSLPIKELQRRGVLSKTSGVDLLREVLGFFGVANPEAWSTVWATPTAYRKSRVHESDPFALASWLRIGELSALEIPAMPFDRAGLRGAIHELRSLTTLRVDEWHPRLVARCAELGVVVVFEPEIPGSRICGAVRWIDSEKALIVMSLRHRWADVFWFSFFHEIAHVLLHDRKRLTFVDGPPGDGEDDELEREANAFSSRTLIPTEFDSRLPELRTRDAITKFAEEIGIHPGIVLGRLQHDKVLGYNQLNDLKERYVFSI
jgi:HTH-type transcriptional regulator/antitoxin HigA